MELLLRFARIAAVLGLAAIQTFLYQITLTDHVTLINTPGGGNGLLVTGQKHSQKTSFQGFHSQGSTIGVGNFSASGGTDEVVAFASGRPMAVRTPVQWTSQADTVSLTFADEIAIPVTVWIVKGPVQRQHRRAVEMSLA